MAFTDEQNEQIRKDLIREARRCGITIGMRKTSVEQLTEAVGISKGSFYKFFDSKELLFFAVLEDIHTECFAAAQKSLQENAPLFPADRAAAAILAACRWLSRTKAFVFIENDADFLLHRLPEEVKTEWAKKIPLRRGGTPEDVANIATFLASDMSSYVSGQVIQVDGGMNM